MKGKLQIISIWITFILITITINLRATDKWQTPFDSLSGNTIIDGSELKLDDVFNLVATGNHTFRSLIYRVPILLGHLFLFPVDQWFFKL